MLVCINLVANVPLRWTAKTRDAASALAASVFTRASYPDRLERPVARAPNNVTQKQRNARTQRFSPATLHPSRFVTTRFPKRVF